MTTASSLDAAFAVSSHAIPVDKLFMEHSIRQAMNKPQPRRRRTPNDRGGQHVDSKMPFSSSPEKRSRISVAENGETCERVRVTVRVRPPTNVEEQRDEDGAPFIFLDTEKSTVILRRKGSFVDFTEFQFDAVLPSTAQQVDVYNCAARHVVLDVLQGYNGTIMAYGQTGAGKTYTLSDKLCIGGTSVEGIIPRSAAEIFAAAEQDTMHDYHVSMSYTQIYMEQIQDLLRPDSSNMQIREGESGVYLSGVEEVQVNSADDVMKLLLLGEQNRVFSFTKLNAHSSRSHAIVILTVEKKANGSSSDNHQLDAQDRLHCTTGFVESERILVGKLFLVDLAGSERLKKSGSEGLRASEAMSVNLSLTCLGKCISARADQNSTHVPFRDSKLTRLLQESLGGNAKTSLIINIAPCNDFLQETLSSLLFGSRAMKVATRAIINVEEEFRVLTKNLQETLDMQDERLQSLEASISSKEEQLLQAQKSLEERTKQVEMLREEQNCFNEKFMEQLRVKDERWQNRLEVVRNAAAESNRKRIHHLQLELQKLKATEAIGRGGTLQVLSSGLAKDFAARIIQRSYRHRYLTKLQKEKRNLELLTSFQLMANSATKVFDAMKGIDDYFTRSSSKIVIHTH